MDCCSSSAAASRAAERQFSAARAERDLRRYRENGPAATARVLLASVADHLAERDSVLDIGAGICVLSFELLSKGSRYATLVDASSAYLQAANDEARRRGESERVHTVVADF